MKKNKRRVAGKDYTEDELCKLMRLAKEKGGKKFESAEAFLKHFPSPSLRERLGEGGA